MDGSNYSHLDQYEPASVTPANSSSIVLPGANSDLIIQKINSVLNLYITPVIICVGILGNALAFYVLVGTHLNRQSSSVYLAFLSFADSGFLLSLLAVWLSWVNVHVFHKNGWCQTIIYATYVFSFLSVWTVVAFTTERYIVVFYPLKRHVLCTKKRAIITMISLTVGGLCLYSFAPWTSGVTKLGHMTSCTQLPQHMKMARLFSSMDTVITLIVPSLVIIFMNGRIGVKIYYYTKGKVPHDCQWNSRTDCGTDGVNHRLKQVQHTGCQNSTSRVSLPDSESTCRACAFTPWKISNRKISSQMRTTRALFVISSVFILLNLPSHAFRIYAFAISLRNQAYNISPMALRIQEFLQFLYFLNFATNFFLYNACSRNFRNAFKMLRKRIRYKTRKHLLNCRKILSSNI